MEDSISQPDFWETRWQAFTAASGNRTPSPDHGQGKGRIERWDRLAKDFAQRTADPQSCARREKTLSLLREKGILFPEARVLDIGAGPGAWALAMAPHCAHVTALEPSSGMIDILARRMAAEKTENIRIVQETWQEADLRENSWEEAFDLVFASMTPGIDGPATLKKMMAASRGWCYLSAFSGPGMSRQFAPLWEKLMGTPMPSSGIGSGSDIIYPFNLLYSLGYRPDLTFSWWDKEITWDRDHTLRHFINFFESHLEITPEAEALIAGYVDTRCPQGQYRPEKPVCRGTLIWSVHTLSPAQAADQATLYGEAHC